MALQFLSDAEIEEAELVIALDVEGLHTLLKALEPALRGRIEEPEPQAGPEAGGGEAGRGGGR